MSDLFRLSGYEVSQKIKNQEISTEEYINSIIERIEKVDEKINSFISKNYENALRKAKDIDKRIKCNENIGNLTGIPIGIKDNIAVRGIKNTCASKMLSDYISPYDASVISRINNEDAIIIGKLNMDEFGMGSSSEFSHYGAVHNPWNLDYVTGGSSGGSAAAVASMQVPVSLGTDTGGSIRCPSSFCSVIGMKPTYGTVSRNGLISYSNSLEQIGPVARTVFDLVPLLNTIIGKDFNDDTTFNYKQNLLINKIEDIVTKRYRIGVLQDMIEKCDTNVASVIYEKINLLKNYDCVISETNIQYSDFALASYYIIASAEASSNLSRYDNVRYGFSSNPEGYEWNSYFSKSRSNFGDEVKNRILAGSYVLSAGYYGKYYIKAQQIRSIIIKNFINLFKNFDVLVLPTMPILPYKIGEKSSNPVELYHSDLYTILANLAGLPAISIPAGFSKNGLPIGIQFIANSHDEQKLIDIAMVCEKSYTFNKWCPEI